MGGCGKNTVELTSLFLQYKVFLVYMLIKNGTIAFFRIQENIFDKIL